MPFICWVLLMASLIKGLIKMVTATTLQNTLLISLVWVVWNLIPPTLLLWYWKFGQGRLFTVRPWPICSLLLARKGKPAPPASAMFREPVLTRSARNCSLVYRGCKSDLGSH